MTKEVIYRAIVRTGGKVRYYEVWQCPICRRILFTPRGRLKHQRRHLERV